MAHPIGYYISVEPDHPAAPILKELEERFGSRFEVFDSESIAYLMSKANYDYLGYPLSSKMLEELSYRQPDEYLRLAKLLLSELGKDSGKAVEVING